MLDLVIIGGSAAGASAAIYASRRLLNFKVIARDLGGEVALSGEVNNWPSVPSIQGYELANKFAEHMKSYGAAIDEGFGVTAIASTGDYHRVTAQNEAGEIRTYETKAVIIASGIHPRYLGVPGEQDFFHKGVTYCTVCDGPLYRNKVTATIGAGNSALESVLMMGGIASKVYLLTKYPATVGGGFPKGEHILIEKVKALPNVEIIYEAATEQISGETAVAGITYRDTNGAPHQLDVQGVMVHVGMIPNSTFVDHLEKNKAGEIVINQRCETNVRGIFAAGDVTNVPYKQIGIAVGQGITAALSAIEYLNRMA